MASCLLSGFEKRREMVETIQLTRNYVVPRKTGSGGMGGEEAAGWAAGPSTAPDFPGLNHLYCFWQVRRQGTVEKNDSFLDRQDQGVRQE